MTPTPHTTPLNPKPQGRRKSRVGHSKLRAPEDGAQRPPLASPPSCRAERITLSTAWLQRANPLANNSPILRTSPKILEADGHYPPLGRHLHVSAAQPPPANIPMKLRKAPTTVPDSYSVGSSLPSGTPAAVRPATAGRAAEILIENARLEFRVNGRKQKLAIKSNRERMTLSFSRNHGKTAGPAKSGGTQTARRMPFVSQGKPALHGNDVVLRTLDRGRGVVLRGRKRKASLTNFEPPECE
jgi:hypothetical protein